FQFRVTEQVFSAGEGKTHFPTDARSEKLNAWMPGFKVRIDYPLILRIKTLRVQLFFEWLADDHQSVFRRAINIPSRRDAGESDKKIRLGRTDRIVEE